MSEIKHKYRAVRNRLDAPGGCGNDRKAVVEMLDWIEAHVYAIRDHVAVDLYEIKWIDGCGEARTTSGANLRDAVSKAMGDGE